MTAGPDGVRDPIPNSPAASGSRDTYRVLWIVGSTRSSSRCALSPRHERVLEQPWTTAVLSSRALFVIRCRSGPSPRSVAAEAARRLDGLQLAEIEVADRLQSLRGGTLLQVDWQALQPN